MPPYIEIHYEHLLLVFAYGALGVFGIALALTSRRYFLGREQTKHDHVEKFPDGIEEGSGGVPLFLVLLYVGLGLWALLYILGHGIWGWDFTG